MCFTGHIAEVAKRPRVYLASCADFDLNPVRFGLKMIRTAHDVRRTKIAVLRGNETKDQKLEPFGVTLRFLPRRRFPETLATIEETPEVVAIAKMYRRAARKIVEPTWEDLINASKNYFASLEIMKAEGVPAGIGSHSLETPIACEKNGLPVDYYVKTLHMDRYWSATPEENREEWCWLRDKAEAKSE